MSIPASRGGFSQGEYRKVVSRSSWLICEEGFFLVASWLRFIIGEITPFFGGVAEPLTHHILQVFGEGKAQWWEHSPPTNVARVQIPPSTSYVGWVWCWFSPLFQEIFHRALQFFPLFKTQHFQFPEFLQRKVDEEPLCGCASSYFKSIFIYLGLGSSIAIARFVALPKKLHSILSLIEEYIWVPIQGGVAILVGATYKTTRVFLCFSFLGSIGNNTITWENACW